MALLAARRSPTGLEIEPFDVDRSTSLADVRPVLDASPILSVQYDSYFGRWTTIDSRRPCPMTSSSARAGPVGPWSDATRVFATERKGLGWTH
jgi:hypothetical protein